MTPSDRDSPAQTDTHDLRVGRILNDVLDRRAEGERVTEEVLLAANPELADELREHLAMLRGMDRDRVTIERLITQGVLRPSEDSAYLAELGAYKIVGLLGRGGMGVVLKAHEQALSRTVALKLLRADLAHDEIPLARFKREAKAAAALLHPNIVTVHAVGEEHGTHYFAMEYVDGPTLAERKRSAVCNGLLG